MAYSFQNGHYCFGIFNVISLDDDTFLENQKESLAVLPTSKLGPVCTSLKDVVFRQSSAFYCSNLNKDV